MTRTLTPESSSPPRSPSVKAIAVSIQPPARSRPNPWVLRNSLTLGRSAIGLGNGVFGVFQSADSRYVLECRIVGEGQHVGRMRRCHHLNATIRSLFLDQVQQEPEPRRMDAGVHLLEEVEAGRVLSEQGSQYGEKAQRPVRSTVGGQLSPIPLANGQMNSTAGIPGKRQVRNVHGCKLGHPFGQNLLALLVVADFLQSRRQVLSSVSQNCLAGECGRRIRSGIKSKKRIPENAFSISFT